MPTKLTTLALLLLLVCGSAPGLADDKKPTSQPAKPAKPKFTPVNPAPKAAPQGSATSKPAATNKPAAACNSCQPRACGSCLKKAAKSCPDCVRAGTTCGKTCALKALNPGCKKCAYSSKCKLCRAKHRAKPCCSIVHQTCRACKATAKTSCEACKATKGKKLCSEACATKSFKMDCTKCRVIVKKCAGCAAAKKAKK